MNLSIVTSCHGYGKYLTEWAGSIAKLTTKPLEVCLITHGSEDDLVAGVSAKALLEDAGLPVQHVHLLAPHDFGEARNMAVALASGEWVMHLDADDLLMPHALDDVAALAPHADVVCLGYERSGDLKSGPKNKTKVYKSSRGQTTRDSTAPASGVSPFRRTLWEQAPYRTDLIGGWDTALWLGFSYLNARFVPTKRPCFWYRQHADSVFNIRRLSGWPAARAGHKLQSLRRGDTGVSVVVPRLSDGGGPRDKAWEWLRQRYAARHPTWQLCEGKITGPVWCKGAAVQQGLIRATGNILIIADSDCVVAPEALEQAVELVRTGTPWVVPHTTVHRLTEDDTQTWLRVAPGEPLPEIPIKLNRPAYEGFAGGGIVIVGRPEYEATGGIPISFTGWGAEDEALAVILDTLIGAHTRLAYPLIHLWHPAQKRTSGDPAAVYRANRQRVNRLQLVRNDVDAMWELVGRGLLWGRKYESAVNLHATRHDRTRVMRNQLSTSTLDPFAARNLAAGHRTMAAKNTARRLAREEQQERNRVAREEAEQRKADLRKTPNKMLDREYENKAAG